MTVEAHTMPTFRADVLEQRVRQHAWESPLFSAAAHQAHQLLSREDCQISMLAAILQWDPTLAARILALANSALYAPSRPISRLDEAIVLIGLSEIKSVILAASAAEFVGKLSFQVQRIRNQLCHHACLTGLLARAITRGARLQFGGDEFCAGLLHDIGRILLASLEPQAYVRTESLSEHDREILQKERELLGTDHCLLGDLFCQSQQIPGSIARCVTWHHHALHDPAAYEPLVIVVATADHLSNQLQASTAEDPYDPRVDASLPFLLQALPSIDSDCLWAEVRTAQRQAAMLTLLFSR